MDGFVRIDYITPSENTRLWGTAVQKGLLQAADYFIP